MLVENREFICSNISRDEGGELLFAGRRVSELAEKYFTPLYLYDEERIRERCRTYKSAMQNNFGEGVKVLYASKAASFMRMYKIMEEEGMGLDVVSAGEIQTALVAGYPVQQMYFHSNSKTESDIEFAIAYDVGYIVVDSEDELAIIDRFSRCRGWKQKVLLRITPGIDPHTYKEVATGKVDSKFGSAIETGQAKAITELALKFPYVDLCGFHCHVGSQVFDSSVYLSTARVMLDFVKDIHDELGYMAEELDIGGGYGVRYTAEQPEIDISKNIEEVADFMKGYASEIGIPLPTVILEPGRSIVADAGMTVYSVGTVKKIPGYKNYVSVDGGMTDNPRYALYKAPYTVLPVSGPVGEDAMTVSVVGRCCESGDIIQENVSMPESIARGDLVAVLTTGAYNYSMASNYNRLPRPPVILVRDGKARVAVRRESFEDLVRNDV